MSSPPNFIRNTVALGLGALLISVSAAQPSRDAIRLVRPAEPFALGTRIAAPGETPVPPSFMAVAAVAPALTCRSICSPFTPGLVVTELSWPDAGDSALTAGDEEIRIDVTAASGGFRAAPFSTLKVASVPAAVAPGDADVDVEFIKEQSIPALLQPVRDGRVVARNAAVANVRRVLIKRSLANRGPEMFDRSRIDSNSLGTLELVTAVAQRRVVQRNAVRRVVTLEGLQDGMTYRVALVRGDPARALPAAAEICRIPVCPADVVGAPPGR